METRTERKSGKKNPIFNYISCVQLIDNKNEPKIEIIFLHILYSKGRTLCECSEAKEGKEIFIDMLSGWNILLHWNCFALL